MIIGRAAAWFVRASPYRAAREVGLLAFALMLFPAVVFAGANEEMRAPVLALGAIEIGLVCGLLAAVRIRRLDGPWRQLLPHELLGSLRPAAAAGVAVAVAGLISLPWSLTTGGSPDSWPLLATSVVFAVMTAVATLVAYVPGRLLVHALPVWDRMRRTTLRWALTHALLIGSLTIAGVVATPLTLAAIGGNAGVPKTLAAIPEVAGQPETVLALVITRFVPAALALFLLSLVVGVLVVPPVALIAFPTLSRATRRVEELAAATARLHAGELGARSAVSGEDEIARLQADFNVMAADLQRALEELRAERDAVARLLDERRELIAAVSHELRTPVATLRGYLESTLAHWNNGSPPTLPHDLTIMNSEAERLQRLIDDLFTLSRAEVGQLPITRQPTAVADLLERSARAAAPLAWERGRVEVLAQAPGEIPLAMADPVRLEQVVRNLVANAVRHTPPGGLVLLTAEKSGGNVFIQVRDTGDGIAAADLPRIWDRFYRSVADSNAERGQEGAGLGLALVKELTEAMGGSVAVESTPGEGSSFTVRLPIARADARHPDPITTTGH